MPENKWDYVETITLEDLAGVVVNVLNNRFANLQFYGVETGSGGYAIYVRKIHTTGPVGEETLRKIGRLIYTIKDTFHETNKVAQMRSGK